MEKEPQEELRAGKRSSARRSWSKRQFAPKIAADPGVNLDVPEVPAIRVPPPPSAAMRVVDTPVGELRVAMEALGETLCQRVEQLLESTLERVLGAAFERQLGGSGGGGGFKKGRLWSVESPRVAMEALGETLCQRVEQLLEKTLERVLEAALERNLSTSSLKSLLRSVDCKSAKAEPEEPETTAEPASLHRLRIDEEVVPLTSLEIEERPIKKHLNPDLWPSWASGKPTLNRASPCQEREEPAPESRRPRELQAHRQGSARSQSSLPSSGAAPDESGGNAENNDLKRLRFDEEVVPLASLEYEDRPTKRSQLDRDLWPSWASGRDREALQMVSSERSVKSSRLKVDIRVSFKEIEARGLDTKGNLLDLDSRIMRMAKMPSTVTNKKDFPLLQRLVMHPASNPILVWHIIGPILLLYDIVMIPLQAFPLPDLIFFTAVSIISTAYWSLDTVRGFFTGFETDKSVEMRPTAIANKYLRSWFVLDALTCTVDWAFLIMGNIRGFNKFWRTGRAVHAWRLLRLVRLVRVLKFARRISAFAADRITSLQGLITLRSIYIGFGVTFACHYMACYWYLVGSVEMEWLHEENWLKANHMTNSTLMEVYVACFYWAMGQSGFTPADIFPTNTLEQMYASYVSFCWLIIVSVTINLFSIWLGHLHEATKDRESQNINLRKFLDEHDVSKKLTSRVLRCFRANYVAHQPRVHEEDVDFLRDLPVPLKICLRREVFIPVLKKHPFFIFIGRVNPVLPVMITYCAMREDRHLAGEVIFAESTPAKNMIYVLTGSLNYYAVQSAMGVTKLRPGDWALEPALWLRWTCRGRLVTEITSELVSVDVEKFMAIMHHVKAKGEDTDCVKLFAKSVCDHFLDYCSSTDLWEDKDEVQGLGEEILASRPVSSPPLFSEDGCASLTSWSLGGQV